MTLKQKAFVKALTDPKSPAYCKPSAAYRITAPKVTMESSWVGAHRLLRDSNVSAVVHEQLSVEELGCELEHNLSITKDIAQSATEPSLKLSALKEGRDTLMDYAKLTGKIIDRSEVKNITDADTSAVRDMVRASMRVDSDVGKENV